MRDAPTVTMWVYCHPDDEDICRAETPPDRQDDLKVSADCPKGRILVVWPYLQRRLLMKAPEKEQA